MTVHTIELEKFRAFVNQISDPRDSCLIKMLYLTASRASELLTKAAPWDLLHKKTKPYGIYLKFAFQNFEISPAKPPDKLAVNEKVFLITQAVAKRTKKTKKGKKQEDDREYPPDKIAQFLPDELNLKSPFGKGLTSLRAIYLREPKMVDPLIVKAFMGRLFFKVIALPTSKQFEPWTYDLLKYVNKTGQLSFNLTRQRVWQIVKANLSQLDSQVHPHSLRHWRISHLIENYNFDPYEVTTYSGWTIRSTFGQMGIQASSNLDVYAHLAWRRYFPKLLRTV
jgi:hypothetical protein